VNQPSNRAKPTAHSDRADEAPIEPTNLASAHSHMTQSFFVAQSFYDIVSHFAAMNSAIYLTELSHFALMGSVILLHWIQSFLLYCSVILWFCYNKLSHFVILSAIFLHWIQSFLLQFSDQTIFLQY
jgi:hypothetical protein